MHRAGGEAQFGDACVNDPVVRALRERVVTSVDPAIRRTEGKVTVKLRDGRVLYRHVEHALGTLQHPMSDADLERKFRALVVPPLAGGKADAILKACWSIGTAADAGAALDTATR